MDVKRRDITREQETTLSEIILPRGNCPKLFEVSRNRGALNSALTFISDAIRARFRKLFTGVSTQYIATQYMRNMCRAAMIRY